MSTVQPKLNIQSDQVHEFLLCTKERACALTSLFNKVFPIYNLTTLPRIHMSLAQMAHESMGFTRYVENLNYSAGGLARTWPTRFAINSHAEVKVPNEKAKRLARKPELIANEAYGGRMGNYLPNDGWDFRGSGAIQCTGREETTAYSQFKGFANAADTARLMRETDEFAIDSACWFMTVYKNLLDEMDRGHLEHCTRYINGALIGIESRRMLFERAKKHITQI